MTQISTVLTLKHDGIQHLAEVGKAQPQQLPKLRCADHCKLNNEYHLMLILIVVLQSHFMSLGAV